MASLLTTAVLAILFFSSLLTCFADVPADEITSLPGWPMKLPSRHYSGYFETYYNGNGTKGGYLHYWLTLSERSPATDPLVLWLQGGPGCSSLFGLLYENGQLHVTPNVSSTGVPLLSYNPSAWTQLANMIWLEQPVGVGFSYCSAGSSCTGEDFGNDAYHFFLNFFAAYPELAKNDFHISGESYAGVYVPYVADAIVTGNAGKQNPLINLKGLLIGNGLGGDADDVEQTKRESDFWYGHGAYNYPDELAIEANCHWNVSVDGPCSAALSKAERTIGDYYIYDIYDTCPHDLLARKAYDDLDAQTGDYIPMPSPISNNPILRDLGFVCVLESVSSDFLNRKDTQAAIHVSIANVSTWGPCGNGLDSIDSATQLKQHRQFLHNQNLMAPSDTLGDLYKKLLLTLPILIYSGDVDQCVPYYYSDNWVRNLGYPVKDQWNSWLYGDSSNQHVGGYVTSYQATNTLWFVTVRDSGHMVPQYQPEAALTLFNNYLTGKLAQK